ncbi:lipopolysaccharide biosynthesis protein [Pseudidiomarina taiwanensis]|uniref:Flippase n=1 Tax=Pseudidiomarina taiwanensis TaxID=337250 RepID=A0A432ZKN7_9GAMM|nr:lipopolysaccharide biosynthesis protein [Pseudidiomarina taiwanensis]RUO78400.1 flippase [Pseudidiomarina taiwanensis]
MSLRKKAVHGMSWTLLDTLVNQAGMFFVLAYMARILGPESFGLVGMLAIFVAVAQSLINSGFSQALIQRSKYATSQDFSTVFFINLSISTVLYGSLFLFAPVIAEFYSESRLIEISRILFLVLIINAFSVVAIAKLSIKIDFKSITIANSISTILGATIGIALAINGFEHWSLVWMNIVKSSVNVAALWWRCKWIPKFEFSIESSRQLFGFGSKLLVAGLVAQIVNNLYVLLTGRYFNATQVGYLTQSTQLAQRASGVISSVLQRVTYPIMTSVSDDRERMVRIYKQLLEVTMLITLPAMFGLAAIAEPFVLIVLGEEWRAIVPVVMILCFARVMTPISSINLNILNAIGRSDLFLKVDLFKLPITFAAVLISAPFGINAIAWAVLITYAISFFINAYYPGKLFGFGALSQLKVAWKIFLSALVMFFFVCLIDYQSLIIELALKITIGILIYIAMLLILKVETFISYTKRLMARF